jgi:hypothetical protein
VSHQCPARHKILDGGQNTDSFVKSQAGLENVSGPHIDFGTQMSLPYTCVCGGRGRKSTHSCTEQSWSRKAGEPKKEIVALTAYQRRVCLLLHGPVSAGPSHIHQVVCLGWETSMLSLPM